MTIDSVDDSKISNRTINTNRISNRTYDSKSNRITKLRRSLLIMHKLTTKMSDIYSDNILYLQIKSPCKKRFPILFKKCTTTIVFCNVYVIFCLVFDKMHCAGSGNVMLLEYDVGHDSVQPWSLQQCTVVPCGCWLQSLYAHFTLVIHSLILYEYATLYVSEHKHCITELQFKNYIHIIVHCVQKKNTHSHFLTYLHEWWVDLNKNCSEYT